MARRRFACAAPADYLPHATLGNVVSTAYATFIPVPSATAFFLMICIYSARTQFSREKITLIRISCHGGDADDFHILRYGEYFRHYRLSE